MDLNDERIREAVRRTEILRAPKQNLLTFGTTNIYYYLVTEPAYTDLFNNITETVIREGRVISERPRIVTPYYLSNLEGFSTDAGKYFDTLISTYGPDVPGLFYSYRNEPKELNIVSDNLLAVVEKLNATIDERGDTMAAIIKGQDELWDVALLKFIFEMTRKSVQENVTQMGTRGLLDVDNRGVPADARLRIEELFSRAGRGEADPSELKKELDRWHLFDEYQDRFLAIFHKR